MPDPFNVLPPGLDDRWMSFGITAEFLVEKARWLKEGRNLHGNCRRFFAISGTLVGLARLDYLLASVAFFQAIPGVECALRMHFPENDDDTLRSLFARAVSEGVIHDSLFGEVPRFTPPFERLAAKLAGKEAKTHTARLAVLVPELRNQYFHGTYLLAPDYLHLTIQLRLAARRT